MLITRVLLTCLLFFGEVLCLGGALARGQVTLVGIVRGNDTPALIPGDWTVDMTPILHPGDQENPAVASKREIYVYTVTGGWNTVDLVFSRNGYASVIVTVALAGLHGAHRIGTDIILTKIVQHSAPAPGTLTKELEGQAEIAKRGGPKTMEAFQWNLEVYEKTYEADPTTSREIEAFRSDPEFYEFLSPQEDTDILLYEEMVKWQFGERPALTPQDLFQVADDSTRSLTLRMEAIRILPNLDLTPGESRDVRSKLRALVSDTPELTASALFGLARIGDPVDLETLVDATGSSDPQIAQAATEALASAPGWEDLELLTELSQTHEDQGVRTAAIQGLRLRNVAGSVDELTTSVRTDPSPIVRREAIQALGSMDIPPERRVEVEAAIEGAKADVSPEVRNEAERILIPSRP